MEHPRLVEAIFGRLKPKAGQPRRVPSLFQSRPSPQPNPSRPDSPKLSPSLPKPPPSSAPAGRIAKRFPLGLDLGMTSMTWAQLGVVNGQTTIVELGRRSLSFATLSEPERQAQVGETVRQVVSQHHVGGEVVLSLPLEDVTLRLLKMPSLSEEERTQAIRWQIEQTLPPKVSYDEFIVDYVVLQEIAGSLESRVLVASVPRQRVMAMVDLARGVGLTPVAVEIDPFALAAGLAWQHRFRADQTALVLHLGAATASLSVVAQEQLAFSRSLLTTARHLTQAVVDQLRVSWDEAEGLKREHGLLKAPEAPTGELPAVPADDQALAVAQALASPLENLIVDTLHTFKSFSHQVAQSRIQQFEQVYLSGEAARLPGLVPWLTARLQVPVQLVDPFGRLPMLDPGGAMQSWSQQAPQFAIAMGLALHEVPPETPPA